VKKSFEIVFRFIKDNLFVTLSYILLHNVPSFCRRLCRTCHYRSIYNLFNFNVCLRVRYDQNTAIRKRGKSYLQKAVVLFRSRCSPYIFRLASHSCDSHTAIRGLVYNRISGRLLLLYASSVIIGALDPWAQKMVLGYAARIICFLLYGRTNSMPRYFQKFIIQKRTRHTLSSFYNIFSFTFFITAVKARPTSILISIIATVHAN